MEKIYSNKDVEEKIYKKWEENGYFQPEINPEGKPYCIILPPPNANGALHFGHAMFTVEDILIRYHRMKGYAALWLPGTDHAGIETQFVFEKNLQKEGKSRLDFDQETLYKMIWEYVEKNRGGIENQLRRLGFSLDWSREKYTLDPDIVKLVYKTFKKMYDDGLIYRAHRLVNYCTFDGTSFSDLEVVNEEKEGNLYFIKYPLKEGGFITVATTRPETLFGDTAVMVNPDDIRYKDFIGKTAIVPLINREVTIIKDEAVDTEFGTGVVKVTPAHDFNDFEVGKNHQLQSIQVIGFDGKMQNTGVVDGLYAKQARVEVLKILEEKDLLEKTTHHNMVVKVCYKCKRPLEPLPLAQWFVKVENLKKEAINVVKEDKIKISPKYFQTRYFQWLENLRDWNISRQIVWGIRIPAWHCNECFDLQSKNLGNTPLGSIKTYKSTWVVTEGETPEKCPVCSSANLEQDTDTFDTWFSSGQWPFITLQTTKPGDFEKFYPTSVMETAYDILPAWVSRMVMLGFYVTSNVPFKDVLFHGLVNDPYGKKMSKSKGNVVNPLELIDQYGADAVRFALIYGNATGSDQSLSFSKLDASRKFTNKLWNMGRFIEMQKSKVENQKLENNLTIEQLSEKAINEIDKEWIGKVKNLSKEITQYLDKYQFNFAAERLYEFAWHEFADKYIEDVKNRIDENSFMVLSSLFLVQLKLLHPFMPYVTEEIYEQLKLGDKMLIIEQWPK